MTSRRDLIIGAACILSAGAAVGLKPRRTVSLMAPGAKLSNILPHEFGDWSSRDVTDNYAPETPDSLLARLYGETVARIFTRKDTQTSIMMLMAHGESQSNELQLHRPEVCYPAFGLAIKKSDPIALPIGGTVTLPARQLIAEAAEHRESVIYWTRLGEYFPLTVTEQRFERLYTAMHHYIPDGLLARFSIAGPDSASSFSTMQGFIADLITTLRPESRACVIGTERARLLLNQPKTAKT